MSQTKQIYRSLLRELRLSSNQPRAKRNPTVAIHVRQLVDSAQSKEALDKTLVEARDFLRSSRIYDELVKRYNPTHGMSQDERVHASARRVGLDTPLEFKNEGGDKE
ncbi:hypothetical protein VHUM_03622 [Vanrija humicola]|uniref:Mitochondrial zinc maintenance protein 1, mitochondrial n=1 Tax=Vanrija humicola TaxID=5417 RepID=A0A7D8Z3N1_VANHU|nr:hypothetical protein VHUM_03622 [Vanrija humicola]